MTPARFCSFQKPLSYGEAVSLQNRLVRERIADRIPDTLLLLQHPPVITLGRRGRTGHVMADPEVLAHEGVECHVSSRGGDVTYHAPGQWVLYPILKLGANEMGAHGYLRALEEICLETARRFGVDAYRREGKAGGWCSHGKFAAIGFKFTRWVTQHGLSLNVELDMRGFDLIVGCGLVGEPVTSLREVLGKEACPSMAEVGREMRRQAASALARSLVDCESARL